MSQAPTRPASPGKPSETLEQRFKRLAEVWEKDVAHHSSSSVRENHPAYLEIIALGQQVVPLLLRDLEATHRHWFAALEEITGADPIPETIAGNVPKMADAWLVWAKKNGYKW